jgi:starch-binding outer membrane protein, SusD/RagB family
MKKYSIFSLLILFTLVTLTSCEEALTVSSASNLSDDVVFSDPELTNNAITAIYNIIGENNSYRNRLWLQMGTNTDIEYRSGWSNKDTITVSKAEDFFSLYCPTTSVGDGYNNSDDANPWSRVYSGIEKANLAIEGLRAYGNPAVGNDMGHFLGEALTMRAFYYYDLIKWWGDVPARFKPVSTNTIFMAKSDRDTIYNQIIKDLQEATTLLYGPNTTYTSTTKRLSKDAARGLLARVCLSAAGYAMHPDSTTVGGSTINISVSDERRTELYTIARSACKDIITDGNYELASHFKDVFYDQCQDVETHGRETIWQLPYKLSQRGRMLYNLGLPRVPDGGVHTTQTIGGLFKIMPSFFYDFDTADVRRDITVVPYKVEKNATLGVMEQSLGSGVTGFNLGKWRAEWLSVPCTSTDDGVSPIVLRYADVLLMYAEADLFLGATDGANYFNMVRRRGFGKDIHTASDYDINAITLDDIKKERAFELCGENIRKFDLIRWGELKTKLDLAKSHLTDLKNGTGDYTTVPKNIYYKYIVDNTITTGERVLVIYGLERGETDVKTETDPSGGWNKKEWTTGTTKEELDLSDGFINTLYLGDPDKRQLLPIMNQIMITSNGALTNDYGY